MDICRRGNEVEISDLDPFLAELLRQIPASTNTQDSAVAHDRIYSPPADASQKEICEEWRLYVEPELQRLFQSATETVARDLEQLNGNEKSVSNCSLRIPTQHADAWLNTLNQARLAIAARCNFTETELSDHDRSPVGSRRDLSLFQINFYGFLQEFILREVDEAVNGQTG
jgi:Domain of unknown function (DUF2017)